MTENDAVLVPENVRQVAAVEHHLSEQTDFIYSLQTGKYFNKNYKQSDHTTASIRVAPDFGSGKSGIRPFFRKSGQIQLRPNF